MNRSEARVFKDEIYEQLARIGKALASPRRLELLDLLIQGPRTVDALAQEAALSLANTSQHLRGLHTAGLVSSSKQGPFVEYRIASPGVPGFLREFRSLAASRLAEIERVTRDFLVTRGGVEAVDRDTLLDRLRRAEVVLIDVRPPEEYRAGHIAGAISVPLRLLERRLDQLPREREIVAYCRGPYCVLAIEAVSLLRSRGFRAARLEDGVADWRARGLEVAAGDGAA